jgi:hypothetical protein
MNQNLTPDPEFVKEMQAKHAEQQASQPTAVKQSAPKAQVQAPPLNPSNIYPDSQENKPLQSNQPTGARTAEKPSRFSDQTLIVLIIIFGALIAGWALLDIFKSFGVLYTSGSTAGGSIVQTVSIYSIFNFISVILGIGIMLRKEIARIIYVVVAFIDLIFLLLSILAVGFFVAGAHSSKNIFSIFLSYALVIAPLYFLTRPQVKSLFK